MNRQDLKSTLEMLGQEDVTPDPEFVNRLEFRIEHLPVRSVADVPRRRRLPLPQVPWMLGAIVALLTSAVGVQQFALSSSDHSQSTTTTTTAVTTSTTMAKQHVASPPESSTVPQQAAPSTVATPPPVAGITPTTQAVHATSTTVPRTSESTSTTTSTTVPFDNMSFICQTSTPSGVPTSTCSWSASTSPSFTRYDLQRIVSGGTGTWTVIYSTTNRTTTNYVDTTVAQGQTYSYVIVAYGQNGSIVGYSKHYTTTCCQA